MILSTSHNAHAVFSPHSLQCLADVIQLLSWKRTATNSCGVSLHIISFCWLLWHAEFKPSQLRQSLW